MNVIVHEGPRKDSRSGGFCDLTYSGDKLLTVLVVPKYIGPLDAANHHMVKRPGGIQSRLSWHIDILSRPKLAVNIFVNIVNYVPFIFNEPGKKYLQRLSRKHGKPKALSILAHKLGRAAYFMLKNKEAFNQKKFLGL
jgi:hypothetical protein